MKIFTFDTTLRDGTQGESVSFSVDDKLVIAQKLDELGIDYIEGGWPGSNPKDKEFFERAKELKLHHAKLAAFGATRLMASQLFGVEAADPVTFAAVPLVLAAVAVIACYLPARRASRLDPLAALRRE